MFYTYFVFILKQSHKNASDLKNYTESCYLMVFNDSKAGTCGQSCSYICFYHYVFVIGRIPWTLVLCSPGVPAVVI